MSPLNVPLTSIKLEPLPLPAPLATTTTITTSNTNTSSVINNNNNNIPATINRSINAPVLAQMPSQSQPQLTKAPSTLPTTQISTNSTTTTAIASVAHPTTTSSVLAPVPIPASLPATTLTVPSPVPTPTLPRQQQYQHQPVVSALPTSTIPSAPTATTSISTQPRIQQQQQPVARYRQQQQQQLPRPVNHPSTTARTIISAPVTTTTPATAIRRHQPLVHPLPGTTITAASNNIAIANIKQQVVQHTTAATNTTTKQSKKKKATVTMATAQTATPATTQGENTGRWTAEEHRLFLQGLEQHGKGWKKIASLIKSRTVVQIRTHAQKYFQKLAKARQNGEEGDVSMENRERTAMSSSAKRRRTGTKRKAIASVVASAEREGKRRAAAAAAAATANANSTETNTASTSTTPSTTNTTTAHIPNLLPLPTVTPALAPFIYPISAPSSIAPAPLGTNISSFHTNSHPHTHHTTNTNIATNAIIPSSTSNTANNINNNSNKGTGISLPSITTAHGTISGAALEDSLFRFLTPAPNEPMHPGATNNTNSTSTQVNDIARQVGANPITLPSSCTSVDKNNSNFISSQVGGDVSPTGVADLQSFPTNWVWQAEEPPSWYTKGADVDELLNEAEALDWLADSGDLTEAYTPTPEVTISHHDSFGLETGGLVVEGPPSSKLSEPSLLSLTAEHTNQVNMNSLNVVKSSNINTNLGQQTFHNHPGVQTAPSVTRLGISATMTKNVPTPDMKGISPTPSALNMPPLPSLFESSNDLNTMKKSNTKPSLNNLSSVSLFSSASEAADAVSPGDLLLDNQFDEQAFVTALLDQDSNNNLLNH